MDWVFRSSSSPWDFTELERDEFDHNIEAFSIDSGIFGESNWQKHSTMASSPPPRPRPLPLPLPLPLPRPSEPLSGSSKKPRGDVNEQYVSSCLVDGCKADLSSCREYHRRHRVCEAHSKTPVVAIAGEHQRFCQQCSRFHSVVEFDEVKRSCRKRLDGHNRRRRKPRADTMYLNNYQRFFTNHRGTKLLQFGASPAYTWPHEEKSNQQLHKPQLSSSSSSLSREKKFPFLLSNYSSSSSSSLGQLVEPKHNNDALSLLSNNTSNSSFMAPHLPLTNNNHLIGMIHFRTQGLELENIFLGG